jgi:hypothetical protein
MAEHSKYWEFARLRVSGGYRAVELPTVKTYLHTAFPQLLSAPETDRALCKALFAAWESGEALAGLSLRCCISQGIIQECQAIIRQFGQAHRLELVELLALSLTDLGVALGVDELRPIGRSKDKQKFKPLAYEILASYNPDHSLITTWTRHILRQHPDIKQYLKEQGILLISDWALLNDTSPRRLQRLLTERFDWVQSTAAEAAWVHTAYRAVYLIGASRGGACRDPNLDQLQQMADYLQDHHQVTVSPESILKKLRLYAKQIRVSRLNLQPEPIPEDGPELASQADGDARPDSHAFLAGYRQQSEVCLDGAIAQVVQGRLERYLRPIGRRKPKPAVAQQLLTGLALYYCQGESQTKIAPLLGLQRQDQVSRLLLLSDLRSDIKLHMLNCLKNHIQTVVEASLSPQRLIDISAALDLLLDQLLKEDAAAGSTNAQYTHPQASQLSQHICRYLDTLPPISV